MSADIDAAVRLVVAEQAATPRGDRDCARRGRMGRGSVLAGLPDPRCRLRGMVVTVHLLAGYHDGSDDVITSTITLCCRQSVLGLPKVDQGTLDRAAVDCGSDLPLPDPDPTPRPASGLGQHGDHFDPFYYVADPIGWGWCRVSAVNFPTAERAQAWIESHQ